MTCNLKDSGFLRCLNFMVPEQLSPVKSRCYIYIFFYTILRSSSATTRLLSHDRTELGEDSSHGVGRRVVVGEPIPPPFLILLRLLVAVKLIEFLINKISRNTIKKKKNVVYIPG